MTDENRIDFAAFATALTDEEKAATAMDASNRKKGRSKTFFLDELKLAERQAEALATTLELARRHYPAGAWVDAASVQQSSLDWSGDVDDDPLDDIDQSKTAGIIYAARLRTERIRHILDMLISAARNTRDA